MKTTIQYFVLLFTFTIAFLGQVNARVLTVSNQILPQVAQYTTLQSAHDNAQSGDTIYLYAVLNSYSGISITKKLIIIGSGFTKASNMTGCSKISGDIKFNSGSEGSIITSIAGNFNIEANTSNLTIQRCKLSKIMVNSNLSNIVITNNIIKNSGGEVAISISDNSSAAILNNIIDNNIQYCSYTIVANLNTSILIKNNILFSYFTVECVSAFTAREAILMNNLIVSPGVRLPVNSICLNSPIIYSADKTIWFDDYDNQNYHLKTGSPGINAGTDGKDLGIYGGDSLYNFKDDGAPNLPTIYYINIPSTGNQKDGLSVEIKAKTN